MNERAEPSPIAAGLAPELAGRVRAGSLAAAPVVVGPTGPELEREIEELSADLRERIGDQPPAQIAELGPARELYRSFGIDPTKKRPSSESLLRRVLRRQPFPRILNAVDVGNMLALRFLLPIGLYDAAKIEGPVQLRAGTRGQSYPGIRREEIHLEGRPALVDRSGPFGNPTADSLRTSVDESTRGLWLVIFAPASFAESRLEQHLQTACECFSRHLAGPEVPLRTHVEILR